MHIEDVSIVSIKKVLCITKKRGQQDNIKQANIPAFLEYMFFTMPYKENKVIKHSKKFKITKKKFMLFIINNIGAENIKYIGGFQYVFNIFVTSLKLQLVNLFINSYSVSKDLDISIIQATSSFKYE